MRISDWSSDVCSSDLEDLVAVPLVPGLEVEAGEAADGGAVGAEMVLAGGKGDLGAEVRGRDLEAQVAVVLGHRPVQLVDEDDVGLTSGEASLDQPLAECAGVDGGPAAVVPGRFQTPFVALANRIQRGLGDHDTRVEAP